MNLYIRVLIVLIKGLFGTRMTDILAPARLRLHVLPNDLDFNGHMNNGRYLTIMDLGRLDLILRTGLMRLMIRQKSVPILAAAKIRYRLPLSPFQPYDLETQIMCWDEKWVYIEQRFILAKGPKAGAVAAIAMVKGSFFDRQAGATVPTADLLKAMGIQTESPPMPEYMADWLKAEESLKEVTKVA